VGSWHGKVSSLLADRPGRISAVLLISVGAGATPQSPEDDEEVGDEHQPHAGRQYGDGERR
jgi:hypothetical protein